jgi:hypothetical protein
MLLFKDDLSPLKPQLIYEYKIITEYSTGQMGF